MTFPPQRRGFDWESASTSVAEGLDEFHAIVVIGVDPVATGRVAVALARVQAKKRRVAVGDLFAESPPIQELVQTEDPHGLVDSFLYGVSLSKIAYEVPGAGQLFVMPSGTEPPTYEEILPNPRWHRLTAGFREVGALLVLAAPASAPHIEKLVSATDGAILVGEGVPRKLPVAQVIGSVRETRPETAEREAIQVVAERTWPKRRTAMIAGGLLTLALAGIAFWLATAPISFGPRGRPARTVRPDTTNHAKAIPSPVPLDTAIRASGDTTQVRTVTLPTVVNPSDSTQADAFAVELMAANTPAGAILKLQQDGTKMPAATFSPVLIQGARWYKVIAGAFATPAGADSLLANLRRQKLLDAGSGSVVRVPLAFRIDSGVPAAAVPGMLKSFADRGLPVYALRQDDGTAWLLAGAFESIDQSVLFAESLRGPDVKPVLVYRKGRTF